MSVQSARGAFDSVSLRRRPLLYSLPLSETWTPFEKNKVEGFDSYEITSTTPWNYALVLNDARTISVTQKAVSTNPYETGKAPVSLQVNARRVPSWTLQPNGRAALNPPATPVAPSTPTERIELVPFGSQMLRITDFPIVGTPLALPTSFKDDFASGHPDAWMFYGGGWYARGGEMRPDRARSGGHAVARRAVFADFVLQANVTPGETGNAGITFRVNKPHLGDNSYSGYYLGLSSQNGTVELGRANEDWNSLVSAPLKMEIGKSVPVRIEARGPQIRIWVGADAQNLAAVPLIDARASGAIGVRYYGVTGEKPSAAFSNIDVKAV